MEIFPRAEIDQEVILKKLNIVLSIFSPIAAAILVPHPKQTVEIFPLFAGLGLKDYWSPCARKSSPGRVSRTGM